VKEGKEGGKDGQEDKEREGGERLQKKERDKEERLYKKREAERSSNGLLGNAERGRKGARYK
jgi:hypothetical protein